MKSTLAHNYYHRKKNRNPRRLRLVKGRSRSDEIRYLAVLALKTAGAYSPSRAVSLWHLKISFRQAVNFEIRMDNLLRLLINKRESTGIQITPHGPIKFYLE